MADCLTFSILWHAVGQRLGTHDVACPVCGPDRGTQSNRRRKVLRVWTEAPGFLTYCCARCGVRGYARADGREHAALGGSTSREKSKQESKTSAEARREKARWLWSRRLPACGSPAETYLRKARCYGGPLPATLGFLPGRGEHPPAMIAAFGGTSEPEPGTIAISNEAIAGVHLTRLAPGGSRKAGTETDKITVGTPLGSPIVLAAPGDLAGLAITEGIEDALSVYEATGLGVWAAGAASFMPALAARVPEWIECITILVDDDQAGRTNAYELAERLEQRQFSVRLVVPAEHAEAGL